MRIIKTSDIIKNVSEMCIETNIELSDDMKEKIYEAEKTETSIIGKKILSQLKENLHLAKEEGIPICQDTGMTVVFIRLGQEVYIEGGSLGDAIQEGIRKGYREGYLRNSVVNDPLLRVNTNDNTPGIIHYDVVSGDIFEIIVAPKGFGSENMSNIYMLKPSDGMEGVKRVVIETVKNAGSNACPPFVIGVGIGGSFEKCAFLAKKALTRNLNVSSIFPHIQRLEEELLYEINQLDIGPGGFGGKTTALAINIETFPTHIAGLPVAVNVCCHVNRHCTREM